VIESDDGEPALVMDLLKGEPLSARLLEKGKLGLGETADVLLPVLAAIGAAHAAGVVHRDLKPDNIFLSEGGVRILDFGLAKATLIDAGTARSIGNQSGEIVGTPRYMSPEQAFAEKDVDYRADIWSLGMVLYQCLSGTLPTESDSMGQILKVILSGSIAPLASVAPEIPAELGAMVDSMLARDRAQRPSGLAEVASSLARAAGKPVPEIAPPRRRGEAAADAEPASSERESAQQAFESDSGERSRPRRNLVAWGLASISLVVMAVFALWGDASRRSEPVAGAPAPEATEPVAATVTASATSIAAEPVATVSATATVPEVVASSSASTSAEPRRRRNPKPARSALYEDPSDLDF
jgi:eukaryotic-like serine/threonine-protein kinase